MYTGPKQQLLKKNLNGAQSNADITDAYTEKSITKSFDIATLKIKNPHKNTTAPKKPLKKRLSTRQKIIKFVDKFFMLLCLAWIIPLAVLWPIGRYGGPLHPELTSSWMATVILFFGIGLGVKLEYLKQACLFWEMNVFTHCVIFLFYPSIGYLVYSIALEQPKDVISQPQIVLLEGTIILCTLPATAASAVVFTANARGNEAAAAINCTISNLMGIFLTPGLILLFMGDKTTINAGQVFYKLSLRVIAPFFVAQLIRAYIGKEGREKQLKKFKPYIKKINESLLLYMVFCALSESFSVGIDLPMSDILIFVLVIAGLHVQGYLSIWWLHKMFMSCMELLKEDKTNLKRPVFNRVACVYSGVSKTIALGIPLIETIYGDDPNVGSYLLPILFYYPCNLIWGSLMVEPLKMFVKKEIHALAVYSSSEITVFTQATYGTEWPALTPFPMTPKGDPDDSMFMFHPCAASFRIDTEDDHYEYQRVDVHKSSDAPK